MGDGISTREKLDTHGLRIRAGQCTWDGEENEGEPATGNRLRTANRVEEEEKEEHGESSVLKVTDCRLPTAEFRGVMAISYPANHVIIRQSNSASASSEPPNPSKVAAPRTPKDVDTRFMAHDLLRALGKRRALEAPPPEVVEKPLVLRPVHSNESSAKTTSVSSRSPSVSVAAPRVPLFLPEPDSEPESAPVSIPRLKCPWSAVADRSGSPHFCVLVSPAPVYVKRHRAKLRAKQESEGTRVEEVPMEPHEEEVPETDLIELKRRRARDEREETVMLQTCTRLRETPCLRVLAAAGVARRDTCTRYIPYQRGAQDRKIAYELHNGGAQSRARGAKKCAAALGPSERVPMWEVNLVLTPVAMTSTCPSGLGFCATSACPRHTYNAGDITLQQQYR
ncbi:hypothetical protein C8R47DRAFT_1192619 [Mycena vitilis]|nr:hypothetical protein C8R47DRAFT_1192619 [Mycena vitilis]